MFRVLVVSLSLLIACQAQSQTVPTELQGIWAEGSCDDPKASFLVNGSFALILRTGPDGQDRMAIGPVAWSGDRVVIERGQVKTPLPRTSGLTRCEMLPARHYLGLGETIAFISALDELRGLCDEAPSNACLTAAFAWLDVSSDNRLSVAELARATRAASTFLAYNPDLEIPSLEGREATLDDLMAPMSDLVPGALMTTAFGPLLIRNLVSSYDYDGDGFLDMEEIAQDRARFLQAAGAAAERTAIATAKSTATVAVDDLAKKASMMMAVMFGFLSPAGENPADQQ